MSRRARLLTRIAAVVIGAVLGSLLLEVVARLLDLDSYERLHPERPAAVLHLGEILFVPDAHVMYRPAPSVHVREPALGLTYETTRLGWRVTTPGAAEQVAKPEGVRRILCLGDSCTFGLRVSGADSYPAQLAARLAGAAEVWNLGVPGYTSAHGLRLMDEIAPLAPDVVVLAFGFNDSFLSQTSASLEFAELDRRPWRWRLRSVVAHSALLRYLYHEVGRSHPHFESVAPGVRWQVRVSPSEYRSNMRALVDRVRALHALPVLIDLDLANDYVRDALVQLASDTGVALIGARDLFARATAAPEPRADDAVPAGHARLVLGSAPAAPWLVAIPSDRKVLVPRKRAFDRAADGSWVLDVPALPPGWEFTLTTTPPKDLRALVQLANYSSFLPSRSGDAGHGLRMDLAGVPLDPYQALLAGDVLHPNARGHELIAAALAAVIEERAMGANR